MVEVTSDAVKFRMTDEATRTQFGVEFRPDRDKPGRTRIKLLHNKKRCEIGIDGARAKAIAAKAQELAAQGNKAEVKRLMTEFRDAGSGQKEYLAFARRVANSPAFGILSAAASLKGSATSDEHQHPVLHIISLAVSLLAPGATKKNVRRDLSGQSAEKQPPRIIKAAHPVKTVKRTGGLSPALQSPCDCCVDCGNFFYVALMSCIFFYFYCTDPWGLNWEWWICDILTAGCIYAVYLATDYCFHVQCYPYCEGDLCP